MKRIDALDFKIIETLKEPGAVTPNATYIAKKLKKPIATIHGRLQRLEKKGIVEKYGFLADHKKFGSNIMGFIFLQAPSGVNLIDYANKLADIKEVIEVNSLVGEWAFICKIRATDMENYSYLINKIFEKMKPLKMEDIISPKTFKREI